MGGKAAILLVLGFSLIFLVFGYNFGNLTTKSMDNFSKYYTETKAYNIAVSGANIAANRVFMDPTWTTGYNNIAYEDGSYDVSVQVIDPYQNVRKITSVGTYNGTTREVKVVLSPSKFSKFAYYSAYEPSSIWWTSGDTVWGPMHVQGELKVANSPVFYGKVTTQNGLVSYGHYEYVETGGYWRWRLVYDHGWTWQRVWTPTYGYEWVTSADPKFYGGYESGIDLPLPTDGVSNLELAADAGGAKFTGQDTVIITFKSDSLNYKFSAKDPQGTTVLTSSFAPNGVIFADDAVVRLSGTVKGQYTLGVSGSYHGKGNVYLDNDIVYNKDPRIYSNSTDLFGIVAEQNVLITDNYVNHSDININASIYTENGGFGAENYSSRPPSGSINLLGGIIQAQRLAVGTFSGTTTTSGFNKKYRYDERFLAASPPHFPGTGMFEIVSWYE